MTREEAETLRNEDRYWMLGILYACKDDPRVIVRNRFPLGWTWNFGHRWVWPTLLGSILFGLAPAALLIYAGVRDATILFAVVGAAVALLVGTAYHIASGPRDG